MINMCKVFHEASYRVQFFWVYLPQLSDKELAVEILVCLELKDHLKHKNV